MGLLENLMGAFLKLTDPTPRFTGQRCLLERNTVGGCDLCQAACPHQAVDLSNFTAQIDATKCTSCGLCTAVCPGAALEFPLGPIQEGLIRGRGQIRCSKVPGSGDEVRCLGQLTPGVLAEAASRFGPLTLAHGDCQSCKIGSPEMPERVQQAVDEGRKFFPALEARLQQEELRGAAVGRREFFGAVMGGAKRSAAEVVPNLPMLEPEPDARDERPAELRLRRMAARRAAEPLSWPKIAIAEGCTLCPVCTNVCPTKAVERENDGNEYSIKLDVSACTGCGACVASCPPQVITLERADRAEVLGERLELHRGTPPWYDM
ncbi:MAG: 4Fe-4S dicluster domain-containing protein [Meiothermus sp.]|nr:4Fe-4S dicluster domain-containing protein [Meiothermus sp.]